MAIRRRAGDLANGVGGKLEKYGHDSLSEVIAKSTAPAAE
jgi:hypothetical protein